MDPKKKRLKKENQDWTDQATPAQGLTPQSELADSLLHLARFLPPGPMKDFAIDLAEWLETITVDEEAQVQFQTQFAEQGIEFNPEFLNGECAQKVAADLRQVVNDALASAVEKAPGILTDFVSCLLGRPKVQASMDAQVNVTCLFKAAMTYFQTRDILKTISGFLSCQFSGGTGGGGGGGFKGTQAKRC